MALLGGQVPSVGLAITVGGLTVKVSYLSSVEGDGVLSALGNQVRYTSTSLRK